MKRSPIWDFFTSKNDTCKCNLCSTSFKVFGSSTSNLTRHMRLKHPVIDIHASHFRTSAVNSEVEDIVCEVDTNDIITSEQQIPSHPAGSLKHGTSSHQTEPSHQPGHQNKMKVQTKITGFASKPVTAKRKELIDDQLLRMIVKDYHAFNMVESNHFKKFVSLLNSNYDIPSRKTLSNSILNKNYDKLIEEAHKEIANNASYVSLTTDGWTSLKNENYLAVTAHFVTKDGYLKSYLLGTSKFEGRHTAENISEELKKIVEMWGIFEKIVACTTDNAVNMVKAVQLCKWWHIPCFAHSLNLVIQASLEKISHVVTKFKSVVEFFKRSPQALEKLHKTQTQMNMPVLNLKQDCPTRWNSTYDMLQRVLQTKEPLQCTLAITNPDLLQKLEVEDGEIIQNCTEILKCFYLVTCEMSAEKCVTISKVCVINRSLYNYCIGMRYKFSNTTVQAFVSHLCSEYTSHIFNKYREITITWEATFLDPRFKEPGFMGDVTRFKETKNMIIQKCSKINEEKLKNTSTVAVQSQPSTSNAVWEEFDTTVTGLIETTCNNPKATSIVEIEKYLNMGLLPRSEDPLIWWNDNKVLFPTLHQLSKRRLCIMATSVPCERIFSKQGQTITVKRTRLTGTKVSKVMFLNRNM